MPLVTKLFQMEMKKAGVIANNHLCSHFAISRADLFNVVKFVPSTRILYIGLLTTASLAQNQAFQGFYFHHGCHRYTARFYRLRDMQASSGVHSELPI